MLKWLKRIAIACGVILAALILLVGATPQGRTAWKTVLFLPQVLSEFPIKPQEWVYRSPSRQEVRFEVEDGQQVADLYTPAGDGIHSAVLLFLGVNPAGRDDSRVVGLAEGLARSGVVVMIPWSDSMTQKRVTTQEIDNLVRAFQFLIQHDRVDPAQSGMGGFCVGASFATVAAQDRRIREDVRFVNFFGGYYDARDLVTSVASNSRFHEAVVEPWSPDKLSREVVTTHLIEGLTDADERALLDRVYISRNAVLDDGVVASLSPEAQTVYRLLSGVDTDVARQLVSSLPEPVLTTLDRISPKTQIDQLDARILIMHDREDQLVPAEESRRLAEALSDRGEVFHTEFSLFQHLDPTRPVSPPVYVKEVFKFYLHMYNVLRELG